MPQPTYEVPPMPPTNHGHTSAAWALSFLVMIGATIAGVAMVFDLHVIMWIGAAICVVGCIVGGALKSAGRGQHHNTEPADISELTAH